MTHAETAQPFLRSQGLQLLVAAGDPFPHLSLTALRQRRATAGAGLAPVNTGEPPPWQPLDREELVARLLPGSDDRRPPRFLRLALTTDAGLGKTVNVQELAYEINAGPFPGARQRATGTHCLAFVIPLVKMPPVTNQDFERCVLLPEFRLTEKTGVETLDDDRALRLLRRLRDSGRLVLLFDGLDQVSRVDALEALLKNRRWDKCPIVLAGRQSAMHRFRKTLIEPFLSQWRFVSLDEFTVDEQRIMLGRTADGSDERYRVIHEEAREILGVPRVLEYLRKVDDRTLRRIQTPSDVYWFAIRNMLRIDLENCKAARKLRFQGAMKLLAALAFEMTSQVVTDKGQQGPNFARVPFREEREADFERFTNRVFRRMQMGRSVADRDAFDDRLDSLAALNDFLDNAFLDVEQVDATPDLTQILWRNRTLQEFFAAYWLARHGTAKDARHLGNWIYVAHEPLTEEYYWIWRFLVEMPAQPSDDGRWVRAVQPLFWPGNVDSAKTKRSSEMIHRAWSRLESLRDDEHNEQAVRDKARRVLALFQGEFEQILAGQFGAERQRAARDFVDHFKNVEPPKPGTFRMGTPDEKQGWSEEVREDHRRWLERGRDNPEGHAKEYYSARPFLGKAGKILRERLEADLASVIRAQDLPELEDWWARHDETPAQDWSDRHIEAFQLNRYPTLNAWYRLFDPDHGTRADFYLSVYQRVSPTGEHPAVFVSWYDAWVFCRWAYWDGRECRLPHEDEWEYVAKAGTPWDRNRWWRDEDELLAKHCTFGQPYDQGGATAPRDCDPADAIYQAGKRKPERDHCNPWSFVDMLGNVWEWTADLYRVKYTRADPPTEYSARVLRGGSWFNRPDFVRSGVRRVYPPTYVYDHVGFRVARALP